MALFDPINNLPTTLPNASGSALTETWAIDASLRYYLGGPTLAALGLRYVPKTNLAAPTPTGLSGVAGAATDAYLTTGNTYAYAIAYRTKWGETVPANRVALTGSTSYALTIAGAPVSTQNPIIERLLYRTSGYTSGTPTDYRLVAVLDAPGGDVTLSITVTDGLPDTMRGPAAQTVDKSAGPIAQVSVSDANYGVWTEVASAPGAGQYSVDYNISSPTAGSILVNTADGPSGVPRTVTIVYKASVIANTGLIQALIGGIKNVPTAMGAALGLASLDSAAHVIQTPATGVGAYKTATATTYGPYFVGFTTVLLTGASHPAGDYTPIIPVLAGDTIVTEIVGQLSANNLGTQPPYLEAWSDINGTANPVQRFYADNDGNVRFAYKRTQVAGAITTAQALFHVQNNGGSNSWGFSAAGDYITMALYVVRG